jgi:hypothetical protein
MKKPEFTQEQKEWICYQIGDWYLMMKPLLEGQHNLGYMKEKLKMMVCDDEIASLFLIENKWNEIE